MTWPRPKGRQSAKAAISVRRSSTSILAALFGFPSVVGQPNGSILSQAQAAGAQVTLVPRPEGDRCNLFISFGPTDQGGFMLSGYMDVVPACEAGWSADPFRLREEGGSSMAGAAAT